MTTTTHTQSDAHTTAATPAFWRPAALAVVGAAAATAAVSAIAHAAGVPITIDGMYIPPIGFAQFTVFFSVIGILIAAGLRRWARNPRVTWVRTTVALTALSLVPDVIVNASVDTKLTLMFTHLVAAAIVIPVIASRLGQSRR